MFNRKDGYSNWYSSESNVTITGKLNHNDLRGINTFCVQVSLGRRFLPRQTLLKKFYLVFYLISYDGTIFHIYLVNHSFCVWILYKTKRYNIYINNSLCIILWIQFLSLLEIQFQKTFKVNSIDLKIYKRYLLIIPTKYKNTNTEETDN